MLKKLFVIAAAAAAVSVPLAGVAQADPATNNGNGGGIGKGGIPERVNDIATGLGLPDATGPDAPNPPGQVLNDQIGHTPGVSTPEAYGSYLNGFFPGVYPDKVPTGMGVKASGPACNRGHTASGTSDPGLNCPRP